MRRIFGPEREEVAEGWRRTFGRPRQRWEDNVRMDFREVWWEVVDWIHLV
jgi:hypothetical protein